MKKLYFIFALLTPMVLLGFVTTNCTETEDDKIKKFLTEMTDARLMDREEGKQAVAKGTTLEIKNYGALMVQDQTYLLAELQKFAKSKNVTVPTMISEKKQKALDKLKEKTGTDFDKNFTKMIHVDHQRDVKKFTTATESFDKEVSTFATKHLPMIASHLQKIEMIKKSK